MTLGTAQPRGKKNAEPNGSAKSKSENGKTLTASEPSVPQGAFALFIMCKIIFDQLKFCRFKLAQI
jgi:hypothetical protein